MRFSSSVTLLLGLSLAIVGLTQVACESTGTSPTPAKATPKSNQPAAVELKKGMPAAVVREQMGEPDKIIPIDDARVSDGEEWIYEKSHETFLGAAATDVRETYYVDPVTGEERTILDPVTELEVEKTERTFHLFIINGILAGWKVEENRSTDYK